MDPHTSLDKVCECLCEHTRVSVSVKIALSLSHSLFLSGAWVLAAGAERSPLTFFYCPSFTYLERSTYHLSLSYSPPP